jgi:hypothetical protein
MIKWLLKDFFVLATLSQNYPNNYENDDCAEASSTEFLGSVARY